MNTEVAPHILLIGIVSRDGVKALHILDLGDLFVGCHCRLNKLFLLEDDGVAGALAHEPSAHEVATPWAAGSGRCLAGGARGRRGTPCPCTQGYAPAPAGGCGPDE